MYSVQYLMFTAPGISLMIWLLGYELRDTIMLFSMEDVFVISSKKKTDFLRPLRDVLAKKDDLPTMTLLTRMKVCSNRLTN